ncbi:MAG: PAS domain-containing protein [Cyclobacteriaceae bacterium]|nr:PAS domain-containing protein [Cyclobacteriaceae bacterium]
MMNPVPDIFSDFKRITARLADQGLSSAHVLDIEKYKRWLTIFHVGDYYYYIFNIVRGEFDFVSPEIEQVTGYAVSEITVKSHLNRIHPDDVPWFLNFEVKVVDFFRGLRPEQVAKYKVRYDYRIRKVNGDYIRILQQVIPLEYNPASGLVVQTFGIHTDITHLKAEGKPVLSILGLEGEPSFIDIQVDKVFVPTTVEISAREKEVLRLLIEGFSSKEIASQLFISKETVDRHRKNILQKTNCQRTPELIRKTIRNGWL